jgi:two-component system, NtrC family, nitrogen regulation sensor histidine kinase NtrY
LIRKTIHQAFFITAILAAACFAFDKLVSDKILLQGIAQYVQGRLISQINSTQEELGADSSATFFDQFPYPAFQYSWEGKLIQWNTNRYLPNETIVEQLVDSSQNELVIDRNSLHYAIKTPTIRSIFIALIPIQVNYTITNDYLKPYRFSGWLEKLYSAEALTDALAFAPYLSSNQPDLSHPIYDENNRPILQIHLTDSTPIRWPIRLMAVLLLFISFSLGTVVLVYQLHRRFRNKYLAIGLTFLVSFGLRYLALWLHFPQQFLETRLFSPQLLAVNDLIPSLADSLWWGVLISLLVWQCYYWVPVLGRQYLEKPFHRWLWLLGYGLAVVVSALLGLLLLQFCFEQLTEHLSIDYTLRDLSSLNIYLFGFYLLVGMIAFCAFSPLYFILRSLAHLQRHWQLKKWHLAILIGGMLLIFQLLLPTNVYDRLLWSGFTIGVLYYVADIRYAHRTWGLLSVFLMLFLASLLINYVLSVHFPRYMNREMRRVAKVYAVNRDLKLEQRFQLLQAKLQAAPIRKSVQRPKVSPAKLLTQDYLHGLVNPYLQPLAGDYDFQVFAFDTAGKRIDNQYELTASRWPMPLGQQTLSRNLEFVAFHYFPQQTSYVGRIPIGRDSSAIVLQVEFQPKWLSLFQEGLYPELLMDKSMKQRQEMPFGYQVALYLEGKYAFPHQLYSVSALEENYRPFPMEMNFIAKAASFSSGNEFYQYVLSKDPKYAIVVRAPQRTWYQHLTTISLLFYCFALLYILTLLPIFIQAILRQEWRVPHHSLTFRIQAYLIGASIIPIAIVLLLTANFFQRYFLSDAYTDLQVQLAQVSRTLQEERYFSPSSNTITAQTPANTIPFDLNARCGEPATRDLLSRISNLLSCDVNLFLLNGRLCSSTKPRIYDYGLAAPIIHPVALRKMTQDRWSQYLTTERISGLSYLSGYFPLMDPKSQQMLAIVNVPYFAQEENLNHQIEKFIPYLVNAYVFIFLIVIVVGIFVSNKLTRPLNLLRQKLEQTKLGDNNEPIAWTSKDEIGAMINAYNQMLNQLAVSEQRLALNERELAWREMARQIAHEIKNPLTPMKLSIQHLARMLQRLNLSGQDAAIERISNTLMTQIDSLTAIANTFAQFATMPVQNLSPITLKPFILEIYHLYQESDEALLSCELPEQEAIILGDKNQLNRALVNIIRNAMQAMESRGKIEIVLMLDADYATVKIADNGKGIPAEIQHRIFQPNFSTKTSGMGLGLAITKRMVENMNGSIRFESRVGIGTTFYLTFPLIEA